MNSSSTSPFQAKNPPKFETIQQVQKQVYKGFSDAMFRKYSQLKIQQLQQIPKKFRQNVLGMTENNLDESEQQKQMHLLPLEGDRVQSSSKPQEILAQRHLRVSSDQFIKQSPLKVINQTSALSNKAKSSISQSTLSPNINVCLLSSKPFCTQLEINNQSNQKMIKDQPSFNNLPQPIHKTESNMTNSQKMQISSSSSLLLPTVSQERLQKEIKAQANQIKLSNPKRFKELINQESTFNCNSKFLRRDQSRYLSEELCLGLDEEMASFSPRSKKQSIGSNSFQKLSGQSTPNSSGKMSNSYFSSYMPSFSNGQDIQDEIQEQTLESNFQSQYTQSNSACSSPPESASPLILSHKDLIKQPSKNKESKETQFDESSFYSPIKTLKSKQEIIRLSNTQPQLKENKVIVDSKAQEEYKSIEQKSYRNLKMFPQKDHQLQYSPLNAVANLSRLSRSQHCFLFLPDKIKNIKDIQLKFQQEQNEDQIKAMESKFQFNLPVNDQRNYKYIKSLKQIKEQLKSSQLPKQFISPKSKQFQIQFTQAKSAQNRKHSVFTSFHTSSSTQSANGTSSQQQTSNKLEQQPQQNKLSQSLHIEHGNLSIKFPNSQSKSIFSQLKLGKDRFNEADITKKQDHQIEETQTLSNSEGNAQERKQNNYELPSTDSIQTQNIPKLQLSPSSPKQFSPFSFSLPAHEMSPSQHNYYYGEQGASFSLNNVKEENKSNLFKQLLEQQGEYFGVVKQSKSNPISLNASFSNSLSRIKILESPSTRRNAQSGQITSSSPSQRNKSFIPRANTIFFSHSKSPLLNQCSFKESTFSESTKIINKQIGHSAFLPQNSINSQINSGDTFERQLDKQDSALQIYSQNQVGSESFYKKDGRKGIATLQSELKDLLQIIKEKLQEDERLIETLLSNEIESTKLFDSYLSFIQACLEQDQRHTLNNCDQFAEFRINKELFILLSQNLHQILVEQDYTHQSCDQILEILNSQSHMLTNGYLFDELGGTISLLKTAAFVYEDIKHTFNNIENNYDQMPNKDEIIQSMLKMFTAITRYHLDYTHISSCKSFKQIQLPPQVSNFINQKQEDQEEELKCTNLQGIEKLRIKNKLQYSQLKFNQEKIAENLNMDNYYKNMIAIRESLREMSNDQLFLMKVSIWNTLNQRKYRKCAIYSFLSQIEFWRYQIAPTLTMDDMMRDQQLFTDLSNELAWMVERDNILTKDNITKELIKYLSESLINRLVFNKKNELDSMFLLEKMEVFTNLQYQQIGQSIFQILSKRNVSENLIKDVEIKLSKIELKARNEQSLLEKLGGEEMLEKILKHVIDNIENKESQSKPENGNNDENISLNVEAENPIQETNNSQQNKEPIYLKGLNLLIISLLSDSDCYSSFDLKAMLQAYSIRITVPISWKIQIQLAMQHFLISPQLYEQISSKIANLFSLLYINEQNQEFKRLLFS